MVSERKLLGSVRVQPHTPTATAMNGSTDHHFRLQTIWTISSGLYFLPGIIGYLARAKSAATPSALFGRPCGRVWRGTAVGSVTSAAKSERT